MMRAVRMAASASVPVIDATAALGELSWAGGSLLANLESDPRCSRIMPIGSHCHSNRKLLCASDVGREIFGCRRMDSAAG
jgi:hypothetical protein